MLILNSKNTQRTSIKNLGLYSVYQGEYDNIIATFNGVIMSECRIIIGRHYDSVRNSQHIPEGLPIKVSNIGDFIAIIANRDSNHLIKNILNTAQKTQPNLKVKALKVFLGVEKFFPHISRSDHAPFWQSRIPAMMWTDTSEFRNPHYHKPSDSPDTLDYDFMQSVVELLAEVILEELG